MGEVFKFKYNGYTFIPLGKIDSEVPFYLANAYNGMLGYDWTNGGLVWNYGDFYNAATSICDACDVFLCVETGYTYTPYPKDLMLWYGKYIPIRIEEENKNE